MLKDIVAVIPLKDHTLQITFEDGLEGTIDIAQLIPFNGIFAPLKELQFFQQVTVSPELGTICWPNGADLDPDVLYASLTHSTASLEHTLLNHLRQLPTKPSLQQLARLPLSQRHQALEPFIAETAEDFRDDPELTEFAALDNEDRELLDGQP